MSTATLATTPAPPYFAVIFTSRRSAHDAPGYDAAAARMDALTRQVPGFIGMDSARGADGLGITVCYWESEAAIAAWRQQLDHAQAQQRGQQVWYEHYEVRVARVDRAYGGPPR